MSLLPALSAALLFNYVLFIFFLKQDDSCHSSTPIGPAVMSGEIDIGTHEEYFEEKGEVSG